MIVKKEITWGGRLLSIETGRWANQAHGSVVVRYGDTTVLSTVTAANSAAAEVDFFPLTVNYVEKFYAAGRIPGGFVKREGRPSERETLFSRLIDRPIRPLFHPNFKNETQVICTVLSFDGKNDADIISIIGASAALMLSGIPFQGPVAAARIGYENGEFLLNPEIGHESDLDLVIAGTRDGVLMVESGAKELSDAKMLEALKFGHASFQPVIEMISELAHESAQDAWELAPQSEDKEKIANEIFEKYNSEIKEAYSNETKRLRNRALSKVRKAVIADYVAQGSLHSDDFLAERFEDACSRFVRNKILTTGRRIDNRTNKDIRPISIDVSVLPRVHGSAVFKRGETQVLAVATLGTAQDEQVVDSLAGENREHFMLHYNFPPFSVGEIGRLGSPGRREIGHGRLALRALTPMLPDREGFPYSMRVVAEVWSCNGSSSMGTVCSSSLALMDAGVPMKNPVAGIAMGLIVDGDNFVILSDIMGEEDHLGDMDFKVAGTKNGITALQMDIKVMGISFDIMEQAMKQANEGRMHILGEMNKVLSENRAELNENVPKMTSFYIPKDKIREVIGSGGKVIREIIEKSGAKVDIDDDGKIMIAAPDSNSMEIAVNMINGIALEPVPNTIYKGKVVKITDFGAFVNFFGSRDGLVHISEMSDKRVEKVTDVMQEGDQVEVLFLGVDNKGRAKLTMKIKNHE